MDQENEVSKIFSVSLGSNKGGREGEIKLKKHILASYSKIQHAKLTNHSARII